MRPQFSLRTMLLATAACGIALAGAICFHRFSVLQDDLGLNYLLLLSAVLGSPAWVPMAYACYLAGRRELSVRSLLVFAVVEAVVIAIAVLVVTKTIIN